MSDSDSFITCLESYYLEFSRSSLSLGIKILKIFKHCNPLGTPIALNNSDHSLLRISSYFLIPHVIPLKCTSISGCSWSEKLSREILDVGLDLTLWAVVIVLPMLVQPTINTTFNNQDISEFDSRCNSNCF